ncbi:MAG: saccharopine dehydrogenase NADP-binding domain-containing protein [Anaerolineae bacterium]|jgi:saccharopine dehydrogenase-like NADP-dependent oxidoreductase|nr:saccharopine dehydrogenase NADP-binding domain-containing protein [Anaerolineae bacterium]
MNIVVLGGCGDMGSHAVRDLLAHSEAHITIADYRQDKAQALASELGERVKGVFVDAEDPASLHSVLQGADVAVGCIGPFYHFAPKMARAAIRARVNYVDICDDWGPIEEVFGLDAEAKQAGITLLCGMGWTPGITNVMARAGADELDKVDDIKIYWAGGAEDAAGLAVVMHVFYAVTGDVPTYKDGTWIKVPASSGKEVVEFAGALGKVEVFHCGHPEPMTIPRYIKCQNVFLKGGLTPKWNNTLADVLVKLGLSKSHQSIVRTSKIIYKLEGLIGAGGIPFSGARVDVVGRKNGEPRTISYAVTDKMGRLTGVPVSIGALMLAQGTISTKGVVAPEGCIEPESFFAELAKRGIRIEKRES